MDPYDVIILGAGPAGSTLAYLLATEGLSVVVVDRSDGPTFKVGESLLPEGIRLCHEIGLAGALADGPFEPKHGAQFVLSADGARDRFAFENALRAERGALAYQVKRLDFDALLQGHAESAGAEIRWGFKTREVHFDSAEEISVSAATGETITARFLADATGQAHVVARQLGLRQPLCDLRKLAMFSHFEGIPREDGDRAGDIIILWNEHGWFWVIPFPDGTTSVGVVGDPKAIQAAGATDQERFDNLCGQTDVHRGYFAERHQLEPLRRHADYSFACRAKIGDRFLLLGDASGFIDPIFSTGVFLAQMGAFEARDVIVPTLRTDGLPAADLRRAFENKLGLATRRYLALVQQFYNASFMADVVRSRRRPQTQKALTSVLAGDIFDEENPLIRMGVFGN